jgi:hypothetical protein
MDGRVSLLELPWSHGGSNINLGSTTRPTSDIWECDGGKGRRGEDNCERDDGGAGGLFFASQPPPPEAKGLNFGI